MNEMSVKLSHEVDVCQALAWIICLSNSHEWDVCQAFSWIKCLSSSCM